MVRARGVFPLKFPIGALTWQSYLLDQRQQYIRRSALRQTTFADGRSYLVLWFCPNRLECRPQQSTLALRKWERGYFGYRQ